jgi:uncharacterized protein YceK
MKVIKATKFFCVSIIVAILISGCASTTQFKTSPSSASVYIDGLYSGTTPLAYKDSKMAGASTSFAFKKDGYKDLYINLKKNEQLDYRALIGGIMFIYPLLWLKKYDPVHYYELEKIEGYKSTISIPDTNHYPIPDTNHYLRGEDERIIVTVDSVIRSISFPEIFKIPYERDVIYHPPSKGYEYVLVQLTIDEKKDLNIEPTEENISKSYLKNERGFSNPVETERVSDNPIGVLTKVHRSMLFEMVKSETPIQLRYYYFYGLGSSKGKVIKAAYIDIDLILHE